MTEERECAGKCLFCTIGDAVKREVVRVAQTTTSSTYTAPFPTKRVKVNFECGLGEIGAECIIPKNYSLAYRGNQVGRAGDDAARTY